MTDSMIERVSMALARRNYKARFGDKPDLIQINVDANWSSWSDDALTAIEAMREPTEEMKVAGSLDPGAGGPDKGYETEVWQAMLDAALGKK